MRKITLARIRLDAYIAGSGEENLVDDICSRIAEGERPMTISRSMDLPWMALRQWLEGSPERFEMYERAKRAYGDKLAWDAIDEVTNADIDTAGLAKLRADVFTRHAGFHDPKVYGAKTQIDMKVDNTVDMKGLLEEREKRLRGLTEVRHVPLLLDVVPQEIHEVMHQELTEI